VEIVGILVWFLILEGIHPEILSDPKKSPNVPTDMDGTLLKLFDLDVFFVRKPLVHDSGRQALRCDSP
jgi:hypothetical protein